MWPCCEEAGLGSSVAPHRGAGRLGPAQRRASNVPHLPHELHLPSSEGAACPPAFFPPTTAFQDLGSMKKEPEAGLGEMPGPWEGC